jgi:hypothetical protein
MTPTEPDSPPPREVGGGARLGGDPGGPDPLDELGQRVRAAQEAAERILAEATDAARRSTGQARAERPPPRGYADPPRSHDRPGAEAQAVTALIDLGRGLVPAELRRAVADLVRELLLLLRALIDWYLERLELRRREPVEVEDIPIS